MLSVIIAVAVVLIDQLTKILVVNNFKIGESVPLIDGVLNFTFHTNKGAAFGILSENRYVFMIASAAIIAVLCFIVYKYHGQSKLFDICLGLIIGGGLGNMIDRVIYGYVVDFIDFCAFDFWTYIFNIADSAVVIGCILAIIFLLFDKKAKSFMDEKKTEESVKEKSDE